MSRPASSRPFRLPAVPGKRTTVGSIIRAVPKVVPRILLIAWNNILLVITGVLAILLAFWLFHIG